MSEHPSPVFMQGEEIKDDDLSVYSAAASSCDGPQLPPFVHFNRSHLPSDLPRSFLEAHAAFCLKDGEAPHVPDYLWTVGESPRSQMTLCRSSTEQAEERAESTPSSASQFENEAPSGGSHVCTWKQKHLQFRALRRAVEFLKQEKQLKFNTYTSSPLHYLLHLTNGEGVPSNTSKDREACGGSGTVDDIHGGASSSEFVASADISSPNIPFSAIRAAGDLACAVKTTPQSREGVGKRKEIPGLANPLLDAVKDDSGSLSSSASTGEPSESHKNSVCEVQGSKKRRGLNTAAMRHKNIENISRECAGNALCVSQAACGSCTTPNCSKDHDIAAFMKNRPDDLKGECIYFLRYGICPYGCCCRFGSSHLDPSGINLLRSGSPVTLSDLQDYKQMRNRQELNVFDHQSKLSIGSKRRRYRFAHSQNGAASASAPRTGESSAGGPHISLKDHLECPAHPLEHEESDGARGPQGVEGLLPSVLRLGAVAGGDEDVGAEERRLRFAAQARGKIFLAPLTTVGNLPFRRLCTRLGADVTVSEMAVANSIAEGKPSELCLLRCGQIIRNRHIMCDFIDLNIACPLDQLHRKFRAGSCMLERPAVVESVVKSLIEACPSVPVTMKVRTAHYGKKHQLHTVIERLSKSGVAAIFAHGRTAQQRYSKAADWSYLTSCKKLMPEDVLLIGCGDILSNDEFRFREQTSGLDALMIGRGALIKPWIFTEIKEQRLWDISACERLEFIKEFVNNGLEHWGSDRRGVATTRRFLLEFLSFTHRYIPPPFLELQPQLIHWRPSPFKGRSDLEVKLSSSNPQDWVDISSMFLGPPPVGFTFVPKHASNAYYVADF
ncbi:tRNA-dihydrouridine(47) synthase [NAD(P)(+)]-like [Cyclospora cayetanensis]|uniref:tRNA-dihydrouridine(47) synthase [NAD(P)(+)] n=1 Tax=Cyclospora cayetanensis TaxID=88456 RepID=A0A6P6S0S4_9EIME|nr:tRNA-dihydrouridine(47) synthase [NAD(P)(+)]-like [Cyclospora cayetanensis]